MSMVEAQLRDLENLREKITLAARNDFVHMDNKDTDIVRDAIDTIQVQSAKLVANNFNGGWIPCSETLPQTDGSYLVCTAKSKAFTMHYYAENKRFSRCNGLITHWMEMPKPPEMGGTE